MEEKRTNRDGFGLAVSVRRDKFWHFSGILWLSQTCTRTKFLHSDQERWLIFSHWLTWLLGPQVTTPRFSSCLSLTITFPWLELTLVCWLLWDLAFPRLLPVSLKRFVWVFRQKIQRNPLTGAHHTNTLTHRANAHYRASVIINIYTQLYSLIYFLRAILNESWQQHPTRRQLYGHLPPITKTIQARRTRHAGHCWRSKDEIVSDVLLWTPAFGQSKAGRPARTYIQQLCDDTGCNPEVLPEAMNDRETWRERVRDIRSSRTIWWWWYSLKLQILFDYYQLFGHGCTASSIPIFY